MLNDNLHVDVQNDNDNVLYIDNSCIYDSANLQKMVNQFSYPADGASTIKGELLCTQVATQHNRGITMGMCESTEANVLSP